MFLYKNWISFCESLGKLDVSILLASEALATYGDHKTKVFIKHDIETNVERALAIAKIESTFGIRATYYFQSYLLQGKSNLNIIEAISQMGHEIAYHYDVLDANNGDWSKASEEFTQTLGKFAASGHEIRTVCPHGNPVKVRNGWSSNKDFFRDPSIAQKYHLITDIVVDFKKLDKSQMKYISDAGYGWKLISDISENDRDDSNPDIALDSLESVLELIQDGNSIMISSHPHRWRKYYFAIFLLKILFFSLRSFTRLLNRNQYLSMILNRFYYLAKKI